MSHRDKDRWDVAGPVGSLLMAARFSQSKDVQSTLTGLFIIGVVGYLVIEFIIKPYLAFISYLDQSFGKEVVEGVSYDTIPGFMIVTVMAGLASLFSWLFSRFNQFPNYASRAILGFSVGLISIHFWFFEGKSSIIFNVLGPLNVGYDRHYHIYFLTFILGLLAWIYFASARFFRFRSKDKAEALSDTPKTENIIKLEKVSIAAFLNRRVNTMFLLILSGIALFDPIIWPLSERWVNSSVSLSVFLHTLATYLFIAYFVLTLQLRSLSRLSLSECYGGYFPPYYIYGLAVIGTFCMAVFAFVPFEYMGKHSRFLQALGPFVYFGISLFRTGKQYYKFLKTTEHMAQSGTEFDGKKRLKSYSAALVGLAVLGALYLHSGHNISYDNRDIAVAIDRELPKFFKYRNGTFSEVLSFKLLPRKPTDKRSDPLIRPFEMVVKTKVLVSSSRKGARYTSTDVTLTGDVSYNKRRNQLELSYTKLKHTSLDDKAVSKRDLKKLGALRFNYESRVITESQLKEIKNNINRAIKKHLRSLRADLLPFVLSPLIEHVNFDERDLKFSLKLG